MKFDMVKYLVTGLVSHPARGAWIEIGYAEVTIKKRHVAPRKGCVD